jgi:hypothetical protein
VSYFFIILVTEKECCFYVFGNEQRQEFGPILTGIFIMYVCVCVCVSVCLCECVCVCVCVCVCGVSTCVCV